MTECQHNSLAKNSPLLGGERFSYARSRGIANDRIGTVIDHVLPDAWARSMAGRLVELLGRMKTWRRVPRISKDSRMCPEAQSALLEIDILARGDRFIQSARAELAQAAHPDVLNRFVTQMEVLLRHTKAKLLQRARPA